jgi:histone deacetylase 1/2
LHGVLKEEVYMRQPPSFEDPLSPYHFFKSDKALYGLKKAPRVWYHRLSLKLQALGFPPSMANTYLFLYNKSGITMLVLIYVDAIIVTSSHDQPISALLKNLSADFALHDLGDLRFFGGIEVKRSSSRLVLTQGKYVTK